MDALRLGPLVLPWTPLLLVLGYAVAVWAAGLAQKAGRGNAEPLLLPLLVLALVAARAGFVARHSADYASALAMLDTPEALGAAPRWEPAFAAALKQIGLDLEPRLEAA